jgi:hypothetical protein
MEGAVIVAKMQVSSVVERKDSKTDEKFQEEVSLQAVYGDNGSANAEWSKWTPAGSVSLTINNPNAFDKFKARYYKVYLVPCEEKD